jgi:hypothetical protein
MKRAFASLVQALFGNLTATGLVWAAIGFAVLIVAALMSFDFGVNLTWKHGVSLAFLSVVAALIPEVAYKQKEEGKAIVAGVLAVVAVPLLVIEFMSHAGYAAGFRGKDITEARVQNAKWTGAQEATDEEKASLALWKKQLEALQAQAPWAATVKADSLRKEAKLLEDRVVLETEGKRGKPKGCGKECESLQNQLKEVNAKIATAEQATSLATRIEATQRVLDGKRDVASKTEHKSSTVQHQNGFFSKAFSLVKTGDMDKADSVAEGSEIILAFAIALIGTGIPALAFFVAGLYRVPGHNEHQVSRFLANVLAQRGSVVSKAAAPAPSANGAVARPRLVNTSFSDAFEKQYA